MALGETALQEVEVGPVISRGGFHTCLPSRYVHMTSKKDSVPFEKRMRNKNRSARVQSVKRKKSSWFSTIRSSPQTRGSQSAYLSNLHIWLSFVQSINSLFFKSSCLFYAKSLYLFYIRFCKTFQLFENCRKIFVCSENCVIFKKVKQGI